MFNLFKKSKPVVTISPIEEEPILVKRYGTNIEISANNFKRQSPGFHRAFFKAVIPHCNLATIKTIRDYCDAQEEIIKLNDKGTKKKP